MFFGAVPRCRGQLGQYPAPDGARIHSPGCPVHRALAIGGMRAIFQQG